MALVGSPPPLRPLPNKIENEERVWNVLFDRNTIIDEFEHPNTPPQLNTEVVWDKSTGDGTHYGLRKKVIYQDSYVCKHLLNHRYKIDFSSPIAYYTNRKKVFTYHSYREFITDPYNEKYNKITTLEDTLYLKNYNYLMSGKDEDTSLRKGESYKILEKKFLFIKIIDCVNGEYCYLPPAALTQLCTGVVKQTGEYYPKTASGVINMALDEFIRRKRNPTQKEVLDFLITLIGNKEFYLSNDSLFSAKIYQCSASYIDNDINHYNPYDARSIYEWNNRKRQLTFATGENEIALIKADFIADTDVKSILSNIGYIKY